MPRRRKRLDPALFDLPVERIRSGYFTDKYFDRLRDALRAGGRSPRVLMQVAAATGGNLGGADEAIAILKLGADEWGVLEVSALYEGDRFEPWETVMTIEGPYDAFAHLETLYVGVLARRTRVCSNVRLAVEAARPKPVLFLGARHDHYAMQAGDGYSALVAGAQAVSTEAHGAFWGSAKLVGGAPHALVAAYGGDTALATRHFADVIGPGVEVIALVDYANDAVATSLAVARALEGRLWGVRLDTPETMVDTSVQPMMGRFPPTGVNPQLVWNVRNALDAEGFGDVKIVASGGFTPARIRAFEDEGVPVDAYGVGGSVVVGGRRYDFMADVVLVDGAPRARIGRDHRPNPRLERVK
ncbi:MAG: quinolinate phosphoribosyl transferase [Gemmatimonadaceae bacterium]